MVRALRSRARITATAALLVVGAVWGCSNNDEPFGGSAASVSLSSTSEAFNAIATGAIPTSRSIQIANGGTSGISGSNAGLLKGLSLDPITYGSGQPADWLQAALAGSVDPTTLTLTPKTTLLRPGVYTARVTVRSTSAKDPRTIDVTYTVGEGPKLAVARPAVVLGTTYVGGPVPPTEQVDVTNSAGVGTIGDLTAGTVVYGAGQPNGWLTTGWVSGRTAPAKLEIRAATSNLPKGDYSATIPVTSAVVLNSPQTINVTLKVDGAPAIAVAPSTLSPFNASAGGPTPAAESVAITNSGGGAITGLTAPITYTSGQNWLSATLDGAATPTRLVIQPTRTDLTPGTYDATVTVRSSVAGVNAVPLSVRYTVVALPVIGVNQTSLVFSTSTPTSPPGAQSVSVTNTGTGGAGAITGLEASVAYDAGATDWLTTSLSATSTPATLSIAPKSVSLAAGTYTAKVTVKGTNVSSRTIDVRYDVTVVPPTISTSKSAVALTAPYLADNPEVSEAISVNNGGSGGPITGLTVSSINFGGVGTNWFRVQLSGTTTPVTATVYAKTGSGSFSGSFVISGTAALSKSVSVSYRELSPARLVAQPSVVNFVIAANATQLPSATVQLTNTGESSPFPVAVLPGPSVPLVANWLSVDPISSTGNPFPLTLRVTRSNLTPGTYKVSVQLTPKNANTLTFITVNLTVN